MDVYIIPGKINVEWRNDVKAIVDTWTTYSVSKEEFHEAVLVRGLNHAKDRGVTAWIVDASQAVGSFSQEIQDYIASDVFPSFAKIGVKYFITIDSKVSNLAKTTAATYASKAGPHGLQLVELNNVEDAITWLKAKM